MRTLAIGDIHGCSKALEALLGEVRPEADDLVITLGDYVDRGPDSFGVVERIRKLKEANRVKCLRGNHELMMLAARVDDEHFREWLRCGGRQTLASYSVSLEGHSLDEIPKSHWDFIEHECIDWYETATHFFVHANVYPEMVLSEQPSYMLHWESMHEKPQPHVSGKVMICGHTSQRSGKPLNYGHAICIDTWVYGQGWLTCLDVASGKVWQANQQGQKRSSYIDDFDEN
jgi:serine/threonine protein phosphatase 1